MLFFTALTALLLAMHYLMSTPAQAQTIANHNSSEKNTYAWKIFTKQTAISGAQISNGIRASQQKLLQGYNLIQQNERILQATSAFNPVFGQASFMQCSNLAQQNHFGLTQINQKNAHAQFMRAITNPSQTTQELQQEKFTQLRKQFSQRTANSALLETYNTRQAVDVVRMNEYASASNSKACTPSEQGQLRCIQTALQQRQFLAHLNMSEWMWRNR